MYNTVYIKRGVMVHSPFLEVGPFVVLNGRRESANREVEGGGVYVD